MALEINDKISVFVKDQFPDFYKEDGVMFIKFVEAYYEYLEQQGKSLDYARNLIEYRDIDETTSEFLDEFKKTFLSGLPGLIKSDDRLTIKHIMDFYRAKGTPRAIQLLFRILFDEEASVDNPYEDVLKPSTSEFRSPRYIEVYASDLDKLIELEGLEILGATSSAKAFVESISTQILNGAKVHVLQLSNLRGNFLRGEIVTKSSDGIQDDMPVVTGSLSSVDITLGGQDFAVGDTFNIEADVGKGAQVRVTAVDNATGLVEYKLANGGFGFSTFEGNTSQGAFTSIDVNDQNLQVNNVINAAQSYSNASKIDNASFFRFETVDQKVEKLTYLSGSQFNSDLAAILVANNYDPSVNHPYVVGTNSSNTVIANGHILSRTTDGANGTVVIAPFLGSFGNSLSIAANLVVNTHIFDTNEEIDEESEVTLNISDTAGSFGVGDTVQGDDSGANGIVVSVNASVMTLNGVFGQFVSNDNVQDVTSGLANTANVTLVSVTTSGANGKLGTFTNSNAKQYTLNVTDITGAFTAAKKIKGRRTNAIATITGTPTDTGVGDIYLNANETSNAAVDTYSNASIRAEVIGSNSENVGFRNTKFSNGSTGTFYQNTAAFLVGRDSNTYANVVTVGTGTGSTFKIGSLENEEAITIYTDIIGENNQANVSYLDVVIDGQSSNASGGNSGVGFVDTITITTAGTNYDLGDTVKFFTGGPGGGAPTINATGNVTAVGVGNAITEVTVTAAGSGFFSQNVEGTITTSSGADAVLNANVDFGYGFPKDQNGDFTTVLDNVLTRFSGNVGTIATLTDINPGNNYNFDPFVSVYTRGIAKMGRRDLIVNLTDMNENEGGSGYKNFILGETVNQTVSVPGQTLTVGSVVVQNTSASSNTTSGDASNYYTGSSVTQKVNSTANAFGDVTSTTTTVISIKNGRFKYSNGTIIANTTPFNSGASNTTIDIVSANSANNETSVTSELSANGTVTGSAVAKGQVYRFTNNEDGTGDVGIRRLSFSIGFNNSNVISGATSGAGGTVGEIYEDSNTNPIGDNAVINADAKAANGIVTAVEVLDSGVGYEHNANVTLKSTGNSVIVVSGTANVTTTGIDQGFWASQESFLNTKYIHDNDFYQSHSYVVETGLSLDKYRDILLQTAHIAGTKLFGRVIKESSIESVATVSNSSIGAL